MAAPRTGPMRNVGAGAPIATSVWALPPRACRPPARTARRSPRRGPSTRRKASSAAWSPPRSLMRIWRKGTSRKGSRREKPVTGAMFLLHLQKHVSPLRRQKHAARPDTAVKDWVSSPRNGRGLQGDGPSEPAQQGQTVDVRISMEFKVRGGRKGIILPPDAHTTPDVRPQQPILVALARARTSGKKCSVVVRSGASSPWPPATM